MERKEFYSTLFDETIKNMPLSNLSNSTQIPRSLPGNFYYYDEDMAEFEFFVPFYAHGRFYHLNRTDVLLLFLMTGYEIKKLKILDEERFKVILDNEEGEIIYQHTKPNKFGIRLIINDKEDPLYLEIDGYSTKVLYKTRGMKKPKLLELEEINDIFVDLLTEYVKINLKMLSREDYKSMYF